MTRNCLILFFVTLTAVGTSAAGPQTREKNDATFKTPRTADGRPDLRGVWNFNSGVPLQRPSAFADRKLFTKEEFDKQHAALSKALASVAKFAPVEAIGIDWMDNTLHVEDLRTSLITYPENGRLPATVEGVTRAPDVADLLAALLDPKSAPPGLLATLNSFGAGKKDSYTDLGVSGRCLEAPPVPLVPDLGDNVVQIVQSKDHVALRMDQFIRVVSLDAKAPLPEKLRPAAGVSRGRWEGDTLVIETRNFGSRSQSFGARSRDKVVTERITRTSKNGLEYAAALTDPKTFQDRIELSFPMARVDSQIFESACHEGNYSLRNILAGARADERAAAEKATAR